MPNTTTAANERHDAYLAQRERYAEILQEAAAAVDDRRRSDARNGFPRRLYMYFAPGGADHFGGLCFVGDDVDPGAPWELATGEALSPALPYGSPVHAWIAERACRLPLYPTT